jgi:heme/copper-type cytochrome/quinol oxidase subunit 3
MKKFITACLIVVALIAFTTKPTMAEPITLTVMAITGLIVVASSATVDTAYHSVKDSQNKDGSATLQKNDDRAQAQNDSNATKADQAKSN